MFFGRQCAGCGAEGPARGCLWAPLVRVGVCPLLCRDSHPFWYNRAHRCAVDEKEVRAVVEIVDLRECEKSGLFYGGRAGQKEGILIDGEPWIAK